MSPILPPPLGTRVLIQHSCWTCKSEPVEIRGRVRDLLPGGAKTAFLAEPDEPVRCPRCRQHDEFIITDTYHASPLSAVDLLAELVT